MRAGLGFMAAAAGGSILPTTLQYIETAVRSTSQTGGGTISTSINLGDPASDRTIIIASSFIDTGTFGFDSMDIGGSAMTILSQMQSSVSGRQLISVLSILSLPSSSSGTLNVAMTGKRGYFRCSVYRATGLQALSPVSKFEYATTASNAPRYQSIELDAKKDGFVVGTMAPYRSNAPAVTGVTDDFSAVITGSYRAYQGSTLTAVDNPTFTISTDHGTPTQQERSLAFASFR